MKSVNIDPASLPAGMLMPTQIQAGIQALEAIETAISGRKKASKTKLSQLSAQFYQAIPQSFGYSTPPTIETQDEVDKLFKLMTSLEQVTQGQQLSLSANSTDSQYASLSTDLNLVEDGSDEHYLISTYFESTKGSGHFSGGGWGSGQRSGWLGLGLRWSGLGLGLGSVVRVRVRVSIAAHRAPRPSIAPRRTSGRG